jgi:rod shape-determining protein MreD
MVGLSLVLGFLCVVVQGVLLHSGVASFLVPQCTVLAVVFLAFYEVSVVGAVVAFVIGFLMDLASAEVIGPWAGACVAVYGCFSLLSQRLFIDAGPAAIIIAFVASAMAELLYLSIEPTPPEVTWALVGGIAARAVVTGCCAPLLFSTLIRRVGKGQAPLTGRSTSLPSV